MEIEIMIEIQGENVSSIFKDKRGAVSLSYYQHREGWEAICIEQGPHSIQIDKAGFVMLAESLSELIRETIKARPDYKESLD